MIPLNKNNQNTKQNNAATNEDDQRKNDEVKKSTEDIKKLNSTNFEEIVEFLFLKFSGALKLIGPLFAFCLVMFVVAVSNTVFNLIIPFWMKNFSFFIGVVYFVMALYLLFSILFNYFLAVLIKPGSIEDIKNSKFFRKNDPLNLSNNLIKFENSKLAENLKIWEETQNSKKVNKSTTVKIRFKTNENNEKNENNLNENYLKNEDLHALSNMEKNLESKKPNEINFNFDAENYDEISQDDINNYNSLTGNAIGCIYPKEQILGSLNNQESSNESMENSNIQDESESTTKSEENLQDDDFVKELDQKLEIIEKKKSKSKNSIEIPATNQESYHKTPTEKDNPYESNKYLMKNETENNAPKLSECKYCKDTKPLRAHHCTICGYCVLKMDHHCPWINNCIGQNNHRYFVLFLTHTLLGCIFVLFIGIPIIFNQQIKKTQEYNFIFVLCFAGTFLLTFFNLWNWYLVFKGCTTIEFWSNQTMNKVNKLNLQEFSMNYWRENLLLIFGTKSLFRAIFIPSIKKLPMSGLEWTKMVYPSFTMDFVEFDQVEDLNIIEEEGVDWKKSFDVFDDGGKSRVKNSKYLDLV